MDQQFENMGHHIDNRFTVFEKDIRYLKQGQETISLRLTNVAYKVGR
ncbi:hypothetical protein HY933_04485 [Candidatus Falkowbacteria bacterium]|nr:hypothetical protein [Candidatus Falkowbacteria bacterium]